MYRNIVRAQQHNTKCENMECFVAVKSSQMQLYEASFTYVLNGWGWHIRTCMKFSRILIECHRNRSACDGFKLSILIKVWHWKKLCTVFSPPRKRFAFISSLLMLRNIKSDSGEYERILKSHRAVKCEQAARIAIVWYKLSHTHTHTHLP